MGKGYPTAGHFSYQNRDNAAYLSDAWLMEHYDSARLDELSARLETLEHKINGLEERLARLATAPAAPHPVPDQPDAAHEPPLNDPYAYDPYASPAALRPYPEPPQLVQAPVMAPSAAESAPPRGEGNVGSYLLSGAAALLVLLAAVSLIALVWEQIPDAVKVGGLALLSLAVVSAGTTLAERRPHQQVAAATLTGTGGALGFVTIIGAVLIAGMPALAAFALMAIWGLVLLLVSWTTQQFFTAVVSTLGALVTVAFAAAQAADHPGRAVLIWTLVNGYLLALAAVCALLPRYASGMRLAEWLPTTSMAVTATALLIGPGTLLAVNSPTGMMLLCLPAVVLLIQAHQSGRLLSRSPGCAGVVWEWAGVGAVMALAVLRLGRVVMVAPTTSSLAAALLLLCATASTAALLPEDAEWPWPRNVVGVNLAAMLGVGAAACTVDQRLLLPTVLALALASIPVVRAGSAMPVAVLPLAGLVPLAFAMVPVPKTTVWLALVALLIAVGLSLWLESRLAPPTALPDSPATPPRPVSDLRASLLAVAAWLIGADLVVALPTLVERLAPGTSAAPLVAGASALALSGLGLFTRDCTPLTLATGARAGALEGARDLRTPAVSTVPAIAWTGYMLLAAQSALTLGRADAAASAIGSLGATPLVLLAMALTVAGARLLLPWLRGSGAALAIAISLSVALWWSAMVLTGASPTSMLVTALVLTTGTVCIVVGFGVRATTLRHYGLSLVMLVVVKLALLDLTDGSSIAQILSLLVAGLACFCLSLVYNRFAQEQARQARTAAAGYDASDMDG